MSVRKWSVAILVAVLAWGLTPEASQAQLFGRRGFGGGGYGYGGYGYGGYGSGWGYPGSYGGGWGPGYGYGTRYSYPGYNNNAYYSSTPNGTFNQPVYNGTTSSYQSFYPPMANGAISQSADPCCCGGSGTMQTSAVNQGSGTLVVNVPENAQLFWNGTTPMVGTGTSRRFTLQSNGGTQRIEARWTGPDGNTVTQTRDVTARPNDTVTIDFTNGANATNDGRANEATPNNTRPN